MSKYTIRNHMIKTVWPRGHANEMEPLENPWTSPEETAVLLSAIASYPRPRVLELGTQRGATAVSIGRLLSKIGGHLLTLDVSHPADTMPESQTTEVPGVEAGMYLANESADVQKCVEFHLFDARNEGEMEVLISRFVDRRGRLDVVFFDGDHSLNGLLRDVGIVRPYTLGAASILLFHDVWWDTGAWPIPVTGPLDFLSDHGQVGVDILNLTHMGTTSIEPFRKRGL